MQPNEKMSDRFRGFFPVVIDIETSGFDHQCHAILEIAAVTVKFNNEGFLVPDQSINFHVNPFEGAILDPSSLAFTGINPMNPMRQAIAVDEKYALEKICTMISKEMKAVSCHRAIMVAQNSHFDLGFFNRAIERTKIKKNPFHPFSTIDTASLSALMYGQTVLAKACHLAEIEFSQKEAHSALYDTVKTAELFCALVNRVKKLNGWPLQMPSTDTHHD